MENRRLQYRKYAASYLEPGGPNPPLDQAVDCFKLYDDGHNRHFYRHVSFETVLGLAVHRSPLSCWDITGQQNPRKDATPTRPETPPTQDHQRHASGRR